MIIEIEREDGTILTVDTEGDYKQDVLPLTEPDSECTIREVDQTNGQLSEDCIEGVLQGQLIDTIELLREHDADVAFAMLVHCESLVTAKHHLENNFEHSYDDYEQLGYQYSEHNGMLPEKKLIKYLDWEQIGKDLAHDKQELGQWLVIDTGHSIEVFDIKVYQVAGQ